MITRDYKTIYSSQRGMTTFQVVPLLDSVLVRQFNCQDRLTGWFSAALFDQSNLALSPGSVKQPALGINLQEREGSSCGLVSPKLLYKVEASLEYVTERI